MRQFIFTAIITLLITNGLGVVQSSGQKPSTKAGPFFEVRLPVSVVDETQAVSGLKKGSFRVYENGVRQKLSSLTVGKASPPVYVGLIMDTSASTKSKLGLYREAASNFLYTMVSLRKHKAAFMTFDSEVTLRQDFTDRLDQLQSAVDKVNKTGSQTALYDAVWTFADEKLRNVPGRRVLVLITDGDDTFSRADLNDAIDIAQRTQTTIFTISTKVGIRRHVPIDRLKDDQPLTLLSEETGGKVFYAHGMVAVESAFKKIIADLTNAYVLTYRPKDQKPDGRLRTIEVRLKKRADAARYKIRTRKSYRIVLPVSERQQARQELHRNP